MRAKARLTTLLPWVLLAVIPVHANDHAIQDFGAIGDGRTLNTRAI